MDWLKSSLTKSSGFEDGGDTQFEQTMANMGHSFLRDKAPTLLDYELGFQLLDRDENDTKAVGVYAFKIGKQLLYAPIFFLRGQPKGHELLYVKNQDIFLPLKENWLNYLLNKEPRDMGESVTRQTRGMGQQSPDLNDLATPPSKRASADTPEVDFFPVYSHLKTASWQAAITDYDMHCSEHLRLEDVLADASYPMLKFAAELVASRPAVAKAFSQWYSLEDLQQRLQAARQKQASSSVLDAVNKNQIATGSLVDCLEKDAAKKAKQEAIQKLEVFTIEVVGTPDSDFLSDSEISRILEDGITIRDSRGDGEVSTAIKEIVSQRLTNPTQTGIYQVLVAPGEFERCLVIKSPHGFAGRESYSILIRLDGEKIFGNYPTHKIWVLEEDTEDGKTERQSWDSWFESLADGAPATGRGHYIAVGPAADGTVAMSLDTKYTGSDTSYFAAHPNTSLGNAAYEVKSIPEKRRPHNHCPYSDGATVYTDMPKSSKLKSKTGRLYVPSSFKWIHLGDISTGLYSMCCGEDSRSTRAPLIPADPIMATREIRKKTAALHISHDGLRYCINGRSGLQKAAALLHLVTDYGLRESASSLLLKQAVEQKRVRGEAIECRVKLANPYLYSGGGGNAPAFPESQYGTFNPLGSESPTLSPQTNEVPVDSLSPSNYDRSGYDISRDGEDFQRAVQSVQQAAQSGQKEVFDTAMITNMLKTVRDDSMIDKHVPALLKAVDKLGRILFMFYWHQERFEERYGKQDLAELEDSLRNAFEVLGDVVIFLKQKSIEPYPEEDLHGLDLGEASEI